jgi:hypothetical protein
MAKKRKASELSKRAEESEDEFQGSGPDSEDECTSFALPIS